MAFAVLAVAAYGQVRVITAIPGIPIFTISNPRFPDYILLKNQVQYTPPLGFSYDDCGGVGTDFSFDGLQSPAYKRRRYQWLTDKFTSLDKNFVAWVEIRPICLGEDPRDSVYTDARFGPPIEISTCHIGSIESDFHFNTGVRKSIRECPVTYLPDSYAWASNADTVIVYPLKVWRAYEGKYNHCKVVVIQKNKRGYISLYCLYNDAGAARLEDYLRALSGMFRYRNPSEYKEIRKVDEPTFLG